MLGKQWLNRYASADMRGSAIERNQNRQRKLDGIVTWYFDFMLESLPLMLQLALLLLGCALSRYLWEISLTIALVAIGVTSFGLLFYFFILVAGTAWESCPYQTPGSTFFRYLGRTVCRIVNLAVTAAGNALKRSEVTRSARYLWGSRRWRSRVHTISASVGLLSMIPILLAVDIYHLGRAAVGALLDLPIEAYCLLHRVYTWLHGIYSSLWGFDQQTARLDLRCILWTLQTSLDKLVHLSTLKHLVTITEFTNFDSALVMECFNIFLGCISVNSNRVAIVPGLEQLATMSARCFSQTFRHLSATRPTSSVLADLHQRYHQLFFFATDLRDLSSYHAVAAMTDIHASFHQYRRARCLSWTDCKSSDQGLIPFARRMVGIAQLEDQRMQNKRVPRWILRFALHFLSLDPPSPASVIADCLTIVAIALDDDPSGVLVLDERYIFSVL